MKIFVKILIIVFCLAFLSGCNLWENFLKEKPKEEIEENLPTQEEKISQSALNFVKEKCETYKFDGIESTLKIESVDVLRCPGCYLITLTFDSSQSGYGNRSGQVLIPIVTPHKAEIEFHQGEVEKAVLDGVWDILKQEKIEK